MCRCIRIRVKGKVQGVFFRASTQRQAKKLNITGYAKNVSDGSVEVLACAEQSQLDALLKWLEHGPRLARVDRVTWQAATCAHFPSDFVTL